MLGVVTTCNTKNEKWNLKWQKCSRIFNKRYHLYLCQIVCEMWYIEKECEYYSWSPCTIQVGWTIWSENVTSHKIWLLSNTHIMLPCIPEKYRCCGFITTPSIGVAWVLGPWLWTEMKALWMMVNIYLFRGSGYDPQKLSFEIQTWVKALKALQWTKTTSSNDNKQWLKYIQDTKYWFNYT